MPIFSYKAKQGPSRVVEGSVEAHNEQAAIEELSVRGIVPLSIVEQKGVKPSLQKSFFSSQRIVRADVYTFSYQLVDLLAAGLTLHHALQTLVEQVEKESFKEVIRDVARSVSDGMSFSAGLGKYAHIFSHFYISMVRSGEASGTLEEVLLELAMTLEREHDFYSRIRGALVYPSLIGICGVITAVGILIGIIPRLHAMYEDVGQALPFLTLLVINLSQVLQKLWWFAILLIGGLIWAVRLYTADAKRAATFFDAFVVRIPLWGTLLIKEETVRFVRSMAMLIKNNVAILDALAIAQSMVRGAQLRDDIAQAIEMVRNGRALHEAMKQSKSFPVMVVNMVATGEKSSMLDKSFARVAQSYDKEINSLIKVITTLVEPLLVLCIGLFVGVIVISMLLPIFQINIFVQ